MIRVNNHAATGRASGKKLCHVAAWGGWNLNVMTARIILGFVTCDTLSVRRKVRSGKLFGFHSGVDINPSGVLRVPMEIWFPTFRDKCRSHFRLSKSPRTWSILNWNFESSGEWRLVAALEIPDVSFEPNVLIFVGKEVQEAVQECDHYVVPKSSRSNHPVTRLHIP